MLLRCCLIHITIIILRHILYLVYFCLCLGLGLFMSYLCDLLFIFSLIFIVINHLTSLKQTHLLFVYFSEYLLLFLDDNVDEESELFYNNKSTASGSCLAFAQFFTNFSLALPMKVLLIKKAYMRVASELPNDLGLRKLGNIRKISKLHRIIH